MHAGAGGWTRGEALPLQRAALARPCWLQSEALLVALACLTLFLSSVPVLQLPIRRFVHALLDDRAVLVKCTLSPLCSGRGQQGVLFAQLVDLFRFYSGSPLRTTRGRPWARRRSSQRTTRGYAWLGQIVYLCG